jgi:large subunit ribosomal protein L4
MSKNIDKSESGSGKAFVTAKDLGLSLSKKLSPRGFSIWIKVLLQNWRQGTVGCKGRADVSLSGKKPWKQKGTGKARAGTARSPLWRGGGVIFGPQKRTRKLKVHKQVRSSILNSMVSELINNKKLLRLKWEPSDLPSTKSAIQALDSIGLKDKKIVLMVDAKDFITHASFSNVNNVRIVAIDEINAYELSMGKFIVCLEKDIDVLKEAVSKWR